jgi:hypothetical protein
MLLLAALSVTTLFAQRPEWAGNDEPSDLPFNERPSGYVRPNYNPDVNPMNPGQFNRGGFALATGGTTATTPISYHGGPLINTPAIYIIFYGNWNQTNGSDNAAGKQIIIDWANTVGSSAHLALNQTFSVTGQSISGAATFGGATTLTGSYSTRLRDSQILSTISNTIASGALGQFNPNGVYFLVTSSDVTATSGFCTQYCGWHTSSLQSYGRLRYSFVGNANRCLSSCAAQKVSPNGNAGVDGAISVLTHELEEAMTDPDPRSGWVDASGYENADKCAWTFGHSQTLLPNGSYANMSFGGRNWLIQRNLTSSNFCMVDATHN